jgi:cytochrome b561
MHWCVAVLLLIQIPLAWYMTELPLGPAKFENYGLHKSLGIVLLTLGICRLLWALLTSRPGLPAALPAWQRIFARALEGLLFLVLIVMPFTGWLMSSAANVPVVLFDLIELPSLVAPDKLLFEKAQNGHRLQSYLLMTLVGIHFLAALRHFWVLRDNVFFSMAPLNYFKCSSADQKFDDST